MVELTGLWLPILLSGVFVFAASAIIHMGLRYHWGDWNKMPGEDQVREAIRSAGVAPGNYNLPHAGSSAAMSSPEIVAKMKEGPVGFLTVLPSGEPAMGKNLAQWFVYSVVIGVLVAYLTGRTLGPGTHYLQVFRVAGTVAFLAYVGAEPIASIWFGRKWSTTLKTAVDGLAYALLTAGTFGWLWPQ